MAGSGSSARLVQVRTLSLSRVIDPRGILREFGTVVAEDVEVRVWDSTAELRYIVLPERPAGTEDMTEEELAALVTRDAMVGVARVAPPSGAVA